MNNNTVSAQGIFCKRLFRPHVAAITILVFSLVCSSSLIWHSEQRRLELEQARVSDIAGDYAHALQSGIERSLSATFSLAALVREGKGDIANFEATAREMLPFFPGTASLQLAPDGVVRHIVPLAGNEGAIGHDLFKDPQRRNEAIKSRDAGKLTLAGPFTLKQGGFGAVGRMPVYLDNGTGGRSFWGFTNVLIRFPEVLEPARLANLEQRGFRYELWRLHPDTGKRQIIAASSSAPLIKPVDRSLELPNGTWILSVAPSAGWSDPNGLAFKSALGLVFSLLLCFLTHSLLNTRAKALQIAQKLTSELCESEERYRSLIQKVQAAIILHDGHGCILNSNPLAQELLGFSADQLLGKALTDPEWHFLQEDGEILPIAEYPVNQVLSTRMPLKDFVCGIRRPDCNTVTWVMVNAEPEYDDSGEIMQVILSFVDITERKRTEEERLTYLRFFEYMDRANRAIQGANDLEQMMSDVLDAVLAVFACDRAFLLYPCDPEAPVWRVPMERTRPEYPGALPLGVEIPMTPDVAASLSLLLASDAPVKFGPGTPNPLPKDASERFGFKSLLSIAFHPKVGLPWQFGIHQCSHARVWTMEEERLFQDIGRRLADSMTSLLMYRDLQESEQRYRMVFENSPVSIWEEDFSEVQTFFDGLKQKRVTDIEQYLDRHPDAVRHCAELVKVIDVNRAALTLHGAANKEALFAGLVNTFTLESFDTFRQELICIWNGGTELVLDAVVKTLAGESRHVTVYFSVCPGYEGTLAKILVSLVDISSRKHAEEAMIKLNEELDRRVDERTAELETKNEELEKMNNLFVGRELKMVELKKRIRELEKGPTS